MPFTWYLSRNDHFGIAKRSACGVCCNFLRREVFFSAFFQPFCVAFQDFAIVESI